MVVLLRAHLTILHFSADTVLTTIYNKIVKIGAETTPSNDAIWDEISKQRQHQSTIFKTQIALFWCK